MSQSTSADFVLQSIKDREFAYMLSGTRLKVLQNIPKLEIGSIHLDGMTQGDTAELPRWIAEVLTSLGLCETQEESFASEVFKAVTREKMAGENQIADLRHDFYLKIKRHLAFASKLVNTKRTNVTELDRTRTLIYDLTALRIRKILQIASTLSPPQDIKEKLTPEEYHVFEAVSGLLRSWRAIIMEGS